VPPDPPEPELPAEVPPDPPEPELPAEVPPAPTEAPAPELPAAPPEVLPPQARAIARASAPLIASPFKCAEPNMPDSNCPA
jgi:hypothetical protein